MRGASARDREIWDEFHADWERLALETEQIRQYLLNDNHGKERSTREAQDEFLLDDYTGETRETITRQRIKQAFFRRAVLASYRGRCCISGVSDPRLLVASHIVPWREDKANRLNPRNGLCFSAIHDKAFDSYLFALTDDYRIVLSRRLESTEDAFLQEIFWPISGRAIALPERFLPHSAFVSWHRERMLGAGS